MPLISWISVELCGLISNVFMAINMVLGSCLVTNNVLKAKDRVGGNLVTESEYEDLAKMMRNTGTFEKDSTGDYYTWSNKQTDGMIYSRIDRVLGNVEWF